MMYSLKDNIQRTYIFLAEKPKGLITRKTEIALKKPQRPTQEIDSVGKIFCLWVFLAVIFSIKTML